MYLQNPFSRSKSVRALDRPSLTFGRLHPQNPDFNLIFRHLTKVLSHTRITWRQNSLNLGLFSQFFQTSMFPFNVIFILLMILFSLVTGILMSHHSRLNFQLILILKEQWLYSTTATLPKECVLYHWNHMVWHFYWAIRKILIFD